MTACRALEMARSAGVEMRLDGSDLLLKAASKPPAEVMDAVVRHKPELVALLRPGQDGWSAQDWQVYFETRAAIAEFEGGLPRAEAEARAFTCCLGHWLKHNSASSQPGRCLGCGGDDNSHDPLLPFGSERDGLAWLHHKCWRFWYESRKAEAMTALAAMGIEASANPPDTPLPEDLLEEIDAWRFANRIASRAEAVRMLLREALDARARRESGRTKSAGR